jgi:hypothetical protein
MIRFDHVRLEGDRVRVGGPITAEEALLRRVSFILVQPGVVVEGEGEIGSGAWAGAAGAADLQPGPVTAVGVSVFVDTVQGSTVETRTWCETLELAGS